jgi:hypothetical protein
LKYTFSISARDTDRSLYYAICFGHEVTVEQGTSDFMPTALDRTMFMVWPDEIQARFPPSATISGTAVIVTRAEYVSGEVIISPALQVPVTFTLWGREKIGELTLLPGEMRKRFSFPV